MSNPAAAGRVRFGLTTYGEAAELRALDESEIDSIWTGGHIAWHHPMPEAIVNLARLAALTERARVGMTIPLPLYPPALIAKQLVDLDVSTGGRVEVGVGIGGEYPPEFRAVEVSTTERGRRADEAIPLIRRLWTAEEISHRGRFYSLLDVHIQPAPVQPGGPPMIVAGRQEPAMRRAATLGDGWFPYLFSPRRYAASVAVVREAADAAGRDLSRFGWYAWVFLNIDPDRERAREQAALSIGGNYHQDFSEIVDSVAAVGTTAEVIEKTKAFYDAGARHLVFSPATASEDRQTVIERLLGDVMPALREHAAPAS